MLRNTLERAEKAKKKAVKPDVITAKEIEKSKVVEEKFKKTADIMSATPEELELSASFTNNKGRLPWPLEKGIISGTFGKHSHPELHGIEINNDGIDITTNRGSAHPTANITNDAAKPPMTNDVLFTAPPYWPSSLKAAC